MLHRWFFLIEPRKETSAELAQRLTEDELLLVCSSQLMSHESGDKSDWTEASIRAVVKLAYLAQTLDIFQDEKKRAHIFGLAEISEAVFDRWWLLKQVEYLGRAIESSQELRSFSSKLQAGDNPVVARWAEQVLAQ
jgi:hypothetical protein